MYNILDKNECLRCLQNNEYMESLLADSEKATNDNLFDSNDDPFDLSAFENNPSIELLRQQRLEHFSLVQQQGTSSTDAPVVGTMQVQDDSLTEPRVLHETSILKVHRVTLKADFLKIFMESTVCFFVWLCINLLFKIKAYKIPRYFKL